jgi:DNA-binding Lrp family transcriptional regulator
MKFKRRIKAIHSFGLHLIKNPRFKTSTFHEKYSPYRSKNATYELIQEGFEKEYLLPPQLYCNRGIEVELIENHKNPLELLKSKLQEENTIYAMTLHGDYSLLCFKKGASLLDYMNIVYPQFEGIEDIRDLEISERGELGVDPYPVLWDELDWEIYSLLRRNPRESFGKVAGKIGVSWVTVQDHYEKIIKQCKVFTSFYPETYSGYDHVLLCFRTKYETGLENALGQLDRSSYIYKFNERIIIVLFVKNYNRTVRKFEELEKEKIIRNLKVSTPVFYEKPES